VMPFQEHRIALITDSTCDIPDELIAQYGIMMVPTYIVWDTGQPAGGSAGAPPEIARDRIDMSSLEFYRRLAAGASIPTTSAPAVGDFLSAFRTAASAGADKIVVITLSSQLSATHQSACQAAEMCDLPVQVVDSRGPTMSLGWQVLAAARAREAGAGVNEMIDAAARARAGMVQWVCLNTLEYLHKGGRIGGASRFIGTLLNIKPLVHINHETGLVEAGDRARGRKRSLETLFRLFFDELQQRNPHGGAMHIAVLHGDAPEEAERLVERIRREHAPAELLLSITSPVLGVHTGPAAIALCGYCE